MKLCIVHRPYALQNGCGARAPTVEHTKVLLAVGVRVAENVFSIYTVACVVPVVAEMIADLRIVPHGARAPRWFRYWARIRNTYGVWRCVVV